MSMKRIVLAAFVLTVLASYGVFAQNQPQQPMSFFVASAGPGNGGNLGGLAGADKQCQTLAAAVGAGNRTWRAYLSTVPAGGQPGINARDRIGNGPWYNAKGQLIASNLADLHSDRNNIRKPSALSEKGAEVNGVGDQPNMHVKPRSPVRRSLRPRDEFPLRTYTGT